MDISKQQPPSGPREFWILKANVHSSEMMEPPEPQRRDLFIHVIERSAYDQEKNRADRFHEWWQIATAENCILEKQCADLRDEVTRLQELPRIHHLRKAQRERDQLKAELDALYAAIEPNENTVESAKGEVAYLRDLEQMVGKSAVKRRELRAMAEKLAAEIIAVRGLEANGRGNAALNEALAAWREWKGEK